MKKVNVMYWVFTSLLAFLMAGSAIPNVLMDAVSVKGVHEDLGYPVYFIPFIGMAKLLGVVAILIPGFPKIKEWAYAGLTFDLLGAAYSIYAVGKPDWIFLLLPLALLLGSYRCYQLRQRAKATQQTMLEADPVLIRQTVLQ